MPCAVSGRRTIRTSGRIPHSRTVPSALPGGQDQPAIRPEPGAIDKTACPESAPSHERTYSADGPRCIDQPVAQTAHGPYSTPYLEHLSESSPRSSSAGVWPGFVRQAARGRRSAIAHIAPLRIAAAFSCCTGPASLTPGHPLDRRQSAPGKIRVTGLRGAPSRSDASAASALYGDLARLKTGSAREDGLPCVGAVVPRDGRQAVVGGARDNARAAVRRAPQVRRRNCPVRSR
jgi:hypothetical protein